MTTRTVTVLTCLQSGETLYLPIDSNTTLQVVAGSVVLREPPCWLADTMVVPVVQLKTGQCHQVECAGWMEVQAGANGAEVRSYRPLSTWEVVWQTMWDCIRSVAHKRRRVSAARRV